MFNSLIFWILLLAAGAWMTVSVLLSLLDVLLQFREKYRKTPVVLRGVGIGASGVTISTLLLAWTMVAVDKHWLLPGVLAITIGVAGSWVGMMWSSHRRAWGLIIRAVVLLALGGLSWFAVLRWGSSVVILTGGPTEDPNWEKQRLREKKHPGPDKEKPASK